MFDGPQDLQRWLEGPGAALQAATPQLRSPPVAHASTAFFAAAFMMPHLFQITFAESLSRHTLLQASWTLPLFLLLMALPVPLILWAAQSANESVPLTAYAAYLMTEHWWVGALAFIGGPGGRQRHDDDDCARALWHGVESHRTGRPSARGA
ncbi:hypothetical protein DK37_23810 [Halomonas sp. SUBG004]|nr:hypothetical protein DK37_23810 [Halomonas sp. SUBG004]